MKIYSNVEDAKGLQENERLAREARQRRIAELESESAKRAEAAKKEAKKESEATAKAKGKKKD